MDDMFNHNFTAQFIEHKPEGDQWFEDYQNYRSHSFNAIADTVVNSIKDSLPTGKFCMKLEMYCRILLDNSDLADSKPGAGLIGPVNDAELALYAETFGCFVNKQALEACRQWLMHNSPYFGLGAKTVAEYQALLLKVKQISGSVLYHERLTAIKSLVTQRPDLAKVVLPKGPFDRKHGFYPQH